MISKQRGKAEGERKRMGYIVNYEISAFIISIITMTYFLLCPRLKNRQSVLFFAIGIIVTVIPVLNISAIFIDGKGQDIFITAVNMCYQLMLHMLPCVMAFYILELTGKLTGLKYRYIITVAVPYLTVAALICTTPLTDLIFFIKDGYYISGQLMIVVYISYILYAALCVIILLSSAGSVTVKQKYTVIALIVIQLVALSIQFNNNEYQVIDFSAALSLIIMYIAMQSPSEISDPLTKSYNYSALVSILTEYINRKKHFYVLGYSVNELRHVNEVYGELCGNELLLHMSRTLGSAGELARIYGNEFYVIIKGDIPVNKIYEFAESLPKTLHIKNYEIPIGSTRVVLDSVHFQSSEVLIEFMEFTIRESKERGDDKTLIADQELIRKYYRRQQVKAAVTRAVSDNLINMVYQPIVDAYTGEVVAAEALARLTDPVLGPVSPTEFIAVAEQSGLILELGKCVREKVWKLLSEYDIRGAGINHISVNLSSIECVQKTVMEDILREAECYGVDHRLIAFEVTETAAVASKEILAFNLNMMKTKGFEFHLDDYGTGYSSMSSLISLPFSVIKFDKSIIKLAMEPQRGDLVKHTIGPMHGYGVKIVIEGIETETQAEKARSWGVDYIQGYLYSEPLPKDAFLEYACIKKIADKQLQTV